VVGSEGIFVNLAVAKSADEYFAAVFSIHERLTSNSKLRVSVESPLIKEKRKRR
jgi:hypothetical protein